MSLSSTQLPKPKDWQDFERKTCTLFACVLGDPRTRLNGRSGQPQHGVDVYGRRGGTGTEWVGVQCKLSGDEITEAELKAELGKAAKFSPAINEFVLVTTAPRDAKIQAVARQLTTSYSNTQRPIVVEVWGWQDVEDEAAKHPAAHRAFDPTWNPFAEEARQEAAVGFQTLHDKIDGMRQASGAQRLSAHDTGLLEIFRAKVTPDLVQLLREHDFGGHVRRSDLDPLGEISYLWKGPAYEFVDTELQGGFELVMTGIRKLAQLVSAHVYAMGADGLMGSPKTDEDLRHGLTDGTKQAIVKMNEAATALTTAVDSFDRIAKAKS